MLGIGRFTIYLEGLYYILVLSFIVGGAVLREINLLIILAGMMMGPVFINWRYVVVTLRKVEVRRDLPKAVTAGDLLVVHLRATNHRRRTSSWTVVAKDSIVRVEPGKSRRTSGTKERSLVAAWPSWLSGHDAASSANGIDEPLLAQSVFSYIPPQGSADAAYQGRIYQRGRYRLGPLRITTRFPLGLVGRTITLKQEDHLTVVPRMGRLSPRFHRLWGSEGVGSERSRSSRGQMEGEFFGLRDWRHGDSQRWIHWRTSARRDQLAVREFEQQHDPLLALVLDLWIPKLAEPADLETVELAISFAASVAAEHCSRGGSRMIISAAAAKGFRLTGGASTGFLDEVLENLAIVEPSNQNHLGEMVEQTFAKSRQITRSLIVTTRKRLDIDGDEFAQISHDSEHRKTLKSAKIISAAREDFASFFEME